MRNRIGSPTWHAGTRVISGTILPGRFGNGSLPRMGESGLWGPKWNVKNVRRRPTRRSGSWLTFCLQTIIYQRMAVSLNLHAEVLGPAVDLLRAARRRGGWPTVCRQSTVHRGIAVSLIFHPRVAGRRYSAFLFCTFSDSSLTWEAQIIEFPN